ncbi:MAG: DUF3999 domain-containing protein [Polaromonas sp.]|nr:DUF3999 domain-containing protein [Polaromonas sp.]
MKSLLLNDTTRLLPQRPGGFSAGWPALLLAAVLALPLTALAALSSSEDGAADQPQAYALRLPLTLAPGASLQRLALPAQVLVNLQTPNYSDLRIFNAQGQPVAMALARAEPSLATHQQRTLMAYPVLGPATAAGLDGLSLRIEERQGQRIVQINTGGAASSNGTASVNGTNGTNGTSGANNGSNNAASPATPPQLLGALLDARAVSEPLVALALQADLPEAQPVTFTVQASRDLSHWRPLGQTVLFRAGDTRLGESDMALDFADIKDCYLRITWTGAAGQPVQAAVRGATLTTSTGRASSPPVEAALAPPALTDAHTLSFSLPFATPLTALRITPPGSDVLIPLRVLGRNERSQPWTPLASSVVYRLQTAGGVQISAPVALPGLAFRELQLQADAKTPGFGAPPAISLQFEPVQIVFLASGSGPFVLAAGRAGTTAAYLPISSLMPDYRSGQENTLPLAQAELAGQPGAAGLRDQPGVGTAPGQTAPLVVAAPGTGDGLPLRSWVLWGVLLLGVLALALMAGVLFRQAKQPPAQQ